MLQCVESESCLYVKSVGCVCRVRCIRKWNHRLRSNLTSGRSSGRKTRSVAVTWWTCSGSNPWFCLWITDHVHSSHMCINTLPRYSKSHGIIWLCYSRHSACPSLFAATTVRAGPNAVLSYGMMLSLLWSARVSTEWRGNTVLLFI